MSDCNRGSTRPRSKETAEHLLGDLGEQEQNATRDANHG